MNPVLQVALDTPNLYEALHLGVELATNLGCNGLWIEAGTPLLKAWGRISVKLLKDLTNCVVVADSKTMDTGSLEAEIFFKAGADAITVLGVADDSTVLEALDTAKKYRKLVIVDLINCRDPVSRAIELDGLGVDVILYHVGIDVQRKRGLTASDLFEELERLRKAVSAKVAVAGGIKHGEAKKFVEIGVDIIIVGSAITKATNPVEAADRFLEEIRS